MEDGKLKILPYDFYRSRDHEELQVFMLKNGIYVIPTQELIDWLKDFIKNFSKNPIEIGAGNGSIGRALGIRMTDSFMQENPEIKKYYRMMRQEPVHYGEDVEKLEALEAVEKYDPDLVIGAFITHKFNGVDGNALGVDEDMMMEKVPIYIMVGNLDTHGTKPLLTKGTYNAYPFEWLITRSDDQSKNRIFVFDGADN